MREWICVVKNLKGKKHIYGIFFPSDLENTSYSEIEKENLVQFMQ